MAFSIGTLDKLGLKAGGQLAGHLYPAAAGIAGVVHGIGKSMAIGAGIGALKGAITGDNNNSTSALRNVASSAVAGAALGAGARAAFSRRGLSGLAHLAGGLGSAAGTVMPYAGKAAGKAVGAAGFMATHPGLTFAGAAVVGGGMYMGGSFRGNRFNDSDAEQVPNENSVTSRSFQNSATGLVQALNSRRHRG